MACDLGVIDLDHKRKVERDAAHIIWIRSQLYGKKVSEKIKGVIMCVRVGIKQSARVLVENNKLARFVRGRYV